MIDVGIDGIISIAIKNNIRGGTMEIIRYITKRDLENFLSRDISLGTLISVSRVKKGKRLWLCHDDDILEIKIIIPNKEN